MQPKERQGRETEKKKECLKYFQNMSKTKNHFKLRNNLRTNLNCKRLFLITNRTKIKTSKLMTLALFLAHPIMLAILLMSIFIYITQYNTVKWLMMLPQYSIFTYKRNVIFQKELFLVLDRFFAWKNEKCFKERGKVKEWGNSQFPWNA